MNQYITGATIRSLRENARMTQSELGELLGVTDKTVSKWETGKGYPDITLLEPIARVFRVSVPELISGNAVKNTNVSANMLKSRFYVCPLCGNVITAVGEAMISCHGIALPPLEAEPCDDLHGITAEKVEDEYFFTVQHPMTREHHISFMAAVGCDRVELLKLYPEGNPEARFKRRGVERLYFFCNKDGLYVHKLR